jgi:hypothetical protein
MESRVQQVLDSFVPAKPSSALEVMEHLALLRRWYYRGHRLGEIFLADDKRAFPMRRIVRGIGRVLRGEKPEQVIAQIGTAAGATEIKNSRETGGPTL